MSKILINSGGTTVFITDTGVSIPASSQYIIPPQDYLLWAASSDIVTAVGNSSISVSDGFAVLSISDGIDLIKGNFPKIIETFQSGTVESVFSEISSVASGISTEVITYTAASGDKLLSLEFSGSNIAKFETQINGSTAAQYYTYYSNLNGLNHFGSGLPLSAGDEVKLVVLHNRPTLGDFSAKLLILGV